MVCGEINSQLTVHYIEETEDKVEKRKKEEKKEGRQGWRKRGREEAKERGQEGKKGGDGKIRTLERGKNTKRKGWKEKADEGMEKKVCRKGKKMKERRK